MHDHTYHSYQQTNALLDIKPFSRLTSVMPINSLLLPRQIHASTGFLIDPTTMALIKPFAVPGDYIITDMPGMGIGVLTADCLPIVLHDTINHAIAIIHAGWRGSVAGIAIKALEHMNTVFGSIPRNIRVFFGPSAGHCCYSVGSEVIDAVIHCQDQVLITRNNQTYFDLPGYNRILLQKAGIPASAFCSDYAECTICHQQFWSYRRQKNLAGRQMTVVSLSRVQTKVLPKSLHT